MGPNLVIHRAFNKGRGSLLVLGDLKAFDSLSFQDFTEPLTASTALLVEVQAAVQHAETFIRIVYPRQFFSKPGMASQFPSNKNPVSLLAFT